jgi:hypothetical protein
MSFTDSPSLPCLLSAQSATYSTVGIVRSPPFPPDDGFVEQECVCKLAKKDNQTYLTFIIEIQTQQGGGGILSASFQLFAHQNIVMNVIQVSGCAKSILF